MQDPSFAVSPDLPFVHLLEEHYPEILAEAEALSLDEYDDWPQREGYNEGWRVFGLVSHDPGVVTLAETCRRNAERCPRTVDVLSRIDGVIRAGFSLLMPGTHIYPHVDGNDEIRCHLGLRTNPRAGLRFEDGDASWEAGRCLVFRGRSRHEAANLGDEPRTVLLIGLSPRALG